MGSAGFMEPEVAAYESVSRGPLPTPQLFGGKLRRRSFRFVAVSSSEAAGYLAATISGFVDIFVVVVAATTTGLATV